MIFNKTSFFCTECMATVELINSLFECDCQQTVYTPDEDGNPAIYDMPKGWINLNDALACFSQVQSHAAAAGLSWQEWIEMAVTVMKSVNVQSESAEKLVGVKLARGEE